MQLFFGSLRVSLYCAFFNLRFMLCILSCTLLTVFLAFSSDLFQDSDVIYALMHSEAAMSIITICVLPILPYGQSFAEEWEERAIRYSILRSGVKHYLCVKILACALTGFLVLLLSRILSALLLLMSRPFFSNIVYTDDPFSTYLYTGHPISYFLFAGIYRALSGAFFSVLGLFISVFYKDALNTISMPMVFYLFSLRFIPLFGTDFHLLWLSLADGIYPMRTPFLTLLLKLIWVCVWIVILGITMTKHVKRMVLND